MEKQRQPLPEIAHTDVGKRSARLFVAACLVSLLYMPLAQHVLPSGDDWGLRAGPFADLAASLGEMRATGDTTFFTANRRLKQHMDDFERELERSSHLKEQAFPTTQWFLLAHGGVGNERVYRGEGGWLYLRGGFDYLTGPPFLDPSVLRRRRLDAPAWQPAIEPDPRPAILHFASGLNKRGIHLVILPAPTKPMVHPEPLARRLELSQGAALHNPSFEAFRAELEAAGVTVFDPAPAMIRARQQNGLDQYLRTDSHWSPEGLDVVAGTLSDRIRHLGLPFTARPSRQRRANGAPPWRRQEQPILGVGDLERILLLPPWQKLFGPQTTLTQRVLSPSGRPWRSDPRAEILLLGDSFTNVYAQPDVGWGRSAGLAAQLSYFLERPVDRLAINAGGASGTRRRLADEIASGRDRLAGKKLVIFQFAVRDLAMGDWQVVELPD